MEQDFTPIILPEDKIPLEAENYMQCEVYTQNPRIIWGEGNPNAQVIVILDNPGARENNMGEEYVCGTRQTLQKTIHHVGLDITNDIYITYLLKCRPLRYYDKEKARAFSKSFLVQQIKRIQPKFIVCLGDTVVKSVFDDKEAHVKNLRGLWHTVMGYPTIVSYHPLAVRRRPNLTKKFIADWNMLSIRFSNENKVE